jgi:hypothetical protein
MSGRFGLVVALAAVTTLVGLAQTSGPRLPLAPLARSGNSITPAQEGWWRNEDGTSTFLIGYYNRNEATIEIPIGPNNHMDPGGPDMGQPTVFLPRRQHGLFAITVPKDFGNKRITWTVVANGMTEAIPLWLNVPYIVDPFRNASTGNTPPHVRFDPNGQEFFAAPKGIAATYQAMVGAPLTLTAWVKDIGDTVPDAEVAGRPRGDAIKVTWSKYRGPGDVKFDPPSQGSKKLEEKFSATATFAAPGEYRLRAQINDASGEGDTSQCCWTNAHINVTVK